MTAPKRVELKRNLTNYEVAFLLLDDKNAKIPMTFPATIVFAEMAWEKHMMDRAE